MKCAVRNCKNRSNKKSKKWRFYRFPKDEKLLAKWTKFCQRENLNTSQERICSAHFKSSDLARNMQFEMGFSSNNGLRLKPGTFPTIPVTIDEEQEAQEEQEELPKIVDRKKIVAQLLGEPQSADMTYNADDTGTSSSDEESISFAPTENCERISFLENENERLTRENFVLNESKMTDAKTIRKQKAYIRKLELQLANVDKSLSSLFTEEQVNNIKTCIKLEKWSKTDISRSVSLIAAKSKSNKILLRAQEKANNKSPESVAMVDPLLTETIDEDDDDDISEVKPAKS